MTSKTLLSHKDALARFAQENETLLKQLPHPRNWKGKSALDYVRWALNNANDYGCRTVRYAVEDAVSEHGVHLARAKKEEERLERDRTRRARAKDPATLDRSTIHSVASRHEAWDRVTVFEAKLREGMTRENTDPVEIRDDVYALTYHLIGFSIRGQRTFEWIDETTIRFENWFPIGD